jgi:phospholipid transport system substrate-binding protein
MMKKNLLFILITLFVVSPAFCDNKSEAVATLEAGLKSVQAVLDDASLTLPMKKAKLVDTVTPMFDFRIMSMLTLGRDHWIKLSGEQQDSFVNAYIKLLKKSFIDKVSLYDHQVVEVLEAIPEGNKMKVPTRILSGDQSILMDYKMYRSKTSGWVIYDVVIQNISVIDSYKGQIRDMMSRGGYEHLIKTISGMIDKE